MKFIAALVIGATVLMASAGSHLGSVAAENAAAHNAKIERAING